MRSAAARIQPVTTITDKPLFTLVEESKNVFVATRQQQQDDHYPAYTKTPEYKAEMMRQQQMC